MEASHFRSGIQSTQQTTERCKRSSVAREQKVHAIRSPCNDPSEASFSIRAFCVGIQNGKGCEHDVSAFGYSQARAEIHLYRGDISEKSSKNLAKLLLCNHCRHQVNQVQQWLKEQPFLPGHGQLGGQKRNLPNYGESDWVTSRFHEVVQG
ncbi:hypothetical protein N7478_000709 [Penicillium angulare]|uniref:uncharacterized protein n=1 Tax=Penicillium angulare TaxID=116970 RepID=UPI0025419B3D|nr:uncharacterized protein N7478_000709 [Penicillium angulare]KAJ5291458.1 hypothetical protein N7478_000709 [Penicillium angulare]